MSEIFFSLYLNTSCWKSGFWGIRLIFLKLVFSEVSYSEYYIFLIKLIQLTFVSVIDS